MGGVPLGYDFIRAGPRREKPKTLLRAGPDLHSKKGLGFNLPQGQICSHAYL